MEILLAYMAIKTTMVLMVAGGIPIAVKIADWRESND